MYALSSTEDWMFFFQVHGNFEAFIYQPKAADVKPALH
jgi:hypothetical protein